MMHKIGELTMDLKKIHWLVVGTSLVWETCVLAGEHHLNSDESRVGVTRPSPIAYGTVIQDYSSSSPVAGVTARAGALDTGSAPSEPVPVVTSVPAIPGHSTPSSMGVFIATASGAELEEFLSRQDYAAAFATLRGQVGYLSNREIVEFLLRSNGYDMDQWGCLTGSHQERIIERLSDGLDELLRGQNYEEAYCSLRAQLGDQAEAADIVKFLLISNGYSEVIWDRLSSARRQEIMARVMSASLEDAQSLPLVPSPPPPSIGTDTMEDIFPLNLRAQSAKLLYMLP